MVLLTASFFALSPTAASDKVIRLGVVSDLVMHLPIFIAEDKKFYADEGLVVQRETKFGKFRTSVSLVNKEVDIVLQDLSAYFELADAYGAEAFKIVGGLTATSGSVIVSRSPIPSTGFAWKQLRRKLVLGRDKNSTPMLFLSSVLRLNGVDPANVKFNTTAPVPARVRIWNQKRAHDYGLFFEPDASAIIRRGTGYFAASLGPAVGKIDLTVFIVRAAILNAEDNKDAVQRFINAIQRSLNWMAKASVKELVSITSRFSKYRKRGGGSRPIPEEDLKSAIERYRSIGFWKQDLRISPQATTEMQRLIIESGGTKTRKHRCYDNVVDMRFAETALAKYPTGNPVHRLIGPRTSADCG
jgi:NitT/TauT family transport system substrate-binding protein